MRSAYQNAALGGQEGVSLYRFAGQLVAQVGTRGAIDEQCVHVPGPVDVWQHVQGGGMVKRATRPAAADPCHLAPAPRGLPPQVTFGCGADCGPNGRCAATSDGSAACACQCGWAGAACDVPSGFCSSFPAELSSAAVCPVAPAPAPAPEAPCRPAQGGLGRQLRCWCAAAACMRACLACTLLPGMPWLLSQMPLCLLLRSWLPRATPPSPVCSLLRHTAV